MQNSLSINAYLYCFIEKYRSIEKVQKSIEKV